MTRGAALIEALLITLATPATWPLALGAFLVRGGIVLVTLPVVVLPTPVGLGNALAPAITPIALGTVPPTVATALVAGSLALVAWIVAGGWLAGALEAEGARIVARDPDLVSATGSLDRPADGRAPSPSRVAFRILAARLVAAIPLALALAWAVVRVVSVTYDELVVPSDTTTPIVVRVVRGAPEVILLVVLAWLLAEVLGAIAARRITLDADAVGPALRAAIVRSARNPLAAVVRFLLPTLGLILVLVPTSIATSAAWGAVGGAVRDRGDPLAVLVTVVLFVGLWIAGLFLVAIVTAWRAAVWTVAEVTAAGTFGGSTDRRPGDWRAGRTSARL
jgi:hypothetical protein